MSNEKIFEKLTNNTSIDHPEDFGRKLFEDVRGAFNAWCETRASVADSAYGANKMALARAFAHDDTADVYG